ncbi:MAG: hypothetical protein NTW44_03795 [Nitrospirae bacterium]|nr:hypothetical protein [Nitrospirota bacterium]
MSKENVRRWAKEIIPVFVILPLSILFSLFPDTITLLKVWKVTYTVFFRFFQRTFSLCLPLYLVNPIYHFIIDKGKRDLLRMEQKESFNIAPIKHWIYRPFQGIGIGFLFGAKLVGLIQITTMPAVGSSPSFQIGLFNLGRLLIVAGITMLISLLLSILWTFDDLGIRYHNRRDQEVKMIGKYAGMMAPLIFGSYGMFTLFKNYPTIDALIRVVKIIIALYPPLVVLAVAHTHFIKRRPDFVSKMGILKEGSICQVNKKL